jgi:hypothetical protein
VSVETGANRLERIAVLGENDDLFRWIFREDAFEFVDQSLDLGVWPGKLFE